MEYQELIKNIKILLADDDEDYLLMTDSFLKQLGYNVETASDGKQAVEKLMSGNYQIALLDYFMPGLNGEEVITEIRKHNKELIIILQTGFSGQKPPIETMQKLNIQNYFDKTEGIDRLNLELISAVKIFNQQTEIELSKYKTKTIGELMNSIAEEIKSDMLSVGAGIEVTNMMISNVDELKNKEEIQKLKNFYEKNKSSLERVDKILDALIAESTGEEKILKCDDIVDLISLIVKNDAKKKEIKFTTHTALKSSNYIAGSINQSIFIISEIVRKLINKSNSGDNIEFVFTEDESNWLLNLNSENIFKIDELDVFMIRRVVSSINGFNIEFEKNKISVQVKKTI